MEQLALHTAALSLAASAVLLPLLLFRRPMGRRFAAKTLYSLWLLLAVRLAVPIPLTLPRPAVTVEVPSRTVVLRPVLSEAAPEPNAPTSNAPAAPASSAQAPQAPTRTVTLPALLAAAWLTGGAVFLLWQAGGYLLARRALLGRARAAGEGAHTALEALRAAMGIRQRVELRAVPGLASPMLLGLFRPVLILPGGGLEGEELEVALRHELTHLRRGDVAYKALLLWANALHWFNPLVWWMVREAGRNLELCCDDEVASGGDAAFRRRYGELLLRTAAGSRGGPALSTRFGGGKEQIKWRLANLFQKKKNSVAVVCVMAAALLLAGSLVACEAGEGRVSEEEALNLLEGSIRYEAGTLSFTIPDVETPSQPWNVQLYGRAAMGEDNFMSFHAMQGIDWSPGETYQEDLSEEAPGLTELAMDITLGETERTVDLLPYVQSDAGETSGLDEADGLPETVPAGAQTLYTNEVYGFALQLPESWAGNWRVEESGNDAAFYCTAVGGETGGLVLNLNIYPEERQEPLLGRERLLGHREGCWVYLYYPQTDMPALAQAGEEAAQRYDTMYMDANGLEGGALSFHAPTAGAETAGWLWPLPGHTEIGVGFGNRVHPIHGGSVAHPGLDIPAPEGTDVLATGNGTVLEAEYDKYYGNYVLLSHGNSLSTFYGHLESVIVEEGDTVKAGDVLGGVGATGEATGSHLHLELRRYGEAVDPAGHFSAPEGRIE